MVTKAKKTIKRRVCIACGGSKFKSYGKLLTECQTCHLVVAKHIPSFAELKKLYEEEYFFGMEYSDYTADRPALEKNFRQRIKFLKKHINSDSKVLEIGCAYGYFLNLIKDDVKYHKGYDVSSEGVAYAKDKLGLNASTLDFLKDKEVANNSIDLVCMWDVMEHFGEPHKHIERASKVLKDGGKLCFTTGNVGAFVARKRGEKWRMVHPPTHIYYFNVESARRLLERYGLRVTSVRHKPTYRNAGSVFNQLIVNKKAQNKNAGLLHFAYKLAKLTKMDKINFPLNLYDVMEVTAVKDA